MSDERCRELLGHAVDHITRANDTLDALHQLLLIGFTPKELEFEFHFNADDIQEALDSMDYE